MKKMYFVVIFTDEYGIDNEFHYQTAKGAVRGYNNVPASAKSRFLMLYTETEQGRRDWKMIISEE